MISLSTSNLFKIIDPTAYQDFLRRISFDDLFSKVNTWIESDEIGFFKLPHKKFQHEEIIRFCNELPKNIDTFLLIGIGGSSLGPKTMYEALQKSSSKKRLFCLENVDPDANHNILSQIIPENTIVNVISKSGSTTETMVNFFHVFSWFKSTLPKSYNAHFVFTTDPTKGLLNKIAKAENIPCFNIPANVGGRFSVLSPVGTLVSQFLGYNIEQLQQGAIDLYSTLLNPIDKNPALSYAIINYFLYQHHHVNMTVLMPYSSQLNELTNWFKQLWAESIGKAESNSGEKVNIGQTPLSSIGATDQHSLVQLFMEGPQDKLVTFLKVTEFTNNIEIKNPFPSIEEFNIYQNTNLGDLLNIELDATAYALTKNNRFNMTLSIQQVNEYSLGQLFYFFEISTAFSGLLYDINPFDQPGVEAGKIATKALLGDSSLAALKRDILG